MFWLILTTLSNPKSEENKCQSWDDVETLVQEAVEEATPDDLLEIQDELGKFFTGLVRRARKRNPVYISPPLFV